MPRRIDVELTSAKEDGSFTWRAAGAKQPKGVVDGSLLYGGAKVGDVVRAEADFDVDGITIVSVVPPPQAAARPAPARIEIVGSGREEPGVTSSPIAKDRGRDDDRRGRRDGERGGPSDGERRGPSDRAARGPRPERSGPRPDRGERPGGPGAPGAPRGDRDRRGPRPERTDRPERGPRPERADRPERGPRPERSGRPERAAPSDRPGRPPREPERGRPKRLSPGSAHRDAYLESLVPEQRVVAELLLRGGIPAVRAAVANQNQNRPEGAPTIDAEPLVGLAEEMLPSVREAEWRDRAEAARAAVDEVGLRDLRAIVTAADASARGEEARALAAELRDALERRTVAQRQEWLAEMETCLANGKTIRALRLSSRPPDPTTKVPPDLLELLRVAAGESMSPETSQDQWAALLEAVVASPVRRGVQPKGLPEKAGPALQLAARQASGRVPALAAMLGVDLPPPPGPRPGRGPRPTPPPPPPPSAPAAPRAGEAGPVKDVAPPRQADDAGAPDQPVVAPVDLVADLPAGAGEGDAAAGDPPLSDVRDADPGVVAADLVAAEEVTQAPEAADVEPALPDDGAIPAAAGAPEAVEDHVVVLDEAEVAADGVTERIDDPDEESSTADA